MQNFYNEDWFRKKIKEQINADVGQELPPVLIELESDGHHHVKCRSNVSLPVKAERFSQDIQRDTKFLDMYNNVK